jgi:hypothetical protein
MDRISSLGVFRARFHGKLSRALCWDVRRPAQSSPTLGGGAFAEIERNMIRERVLVGMARAKGTWFGNNPSCPEAKREAIRLAYERKAAIAPSLNALELPS